MVKVGIAVERAVFAQRATATPEFRLPRRVKRFLQVVADGAVGGLSVGNAGYSTSAVLLVYVKLERHELGGAHGSLQGHASAAIYETGCMTRARGTPL